MDSSINLYSVQNATTLKLTWYVTIFIFYIILRFREFSFDTYLVNMKLILEISALFRQWIVFLISSISSCNIG